MEISTHTWTVNSRAQLFKALLANELVNDKMR